jgi:hypothetical protein
VQKDILIMTKTVGFAIIVAMLWGGFSDVSAQDTCVDMVQTAYDTTQQVCDGTQGDEACYGNVTITALPSNLEFEESGDIVSLTDLEGLRLSTMDTDAGEWGISLIRVGAQLADEETIAEVDLVLFGNVAIDNVAEQDSGFAPMQAFVFQSGVDDRLCDEAPDSGILIQTPQGVGEITFLVNEVSIELGSTAYLQAEPGGDMAVSVVDGGASVSAQGVTIETPAGSQTTIPLDEDGLADGPPTDPQPYDGSLLESLPIVLLTEEIAIAEPIEGEAGGAPQLISGQWQFTLTGPTVCAGVTFNPSDMSNTATIEWAYEGGTLTGASSEGDPLSLNEVEPGVFTGAIDEATLEIRILSPESVLYTVGLEECTLVFDGQLLGE